MLNLAIEIALVSTAALVVFGTLLPLWRTPAWWLRGWEFGRAQFLALGLASFTGLLFMGAGPRRHSILLIVLALALAYQIRRLVPYTPLATKQSISAERGARGPTLSVMVANVLMTNRSAAPLIQLVRDRRPDLVFFAETDAWWAEQLLDLEELYPHRVQRPLENTYGLVLYSRLELIEPEVRHLVQSDIPSVFARVNLDTSQLQADIHGEASSSCDIYCAHPQPPFPTESSTTAPRDAELLILSREIGERDRPTVLIGDLNDVSWSANIRLFQRISRLLDPRLGRGLFSTFHAKWPFLRWPLDHIFHSRHFGLLSIQRMPGFGSDHFPLYASLQLTREAPADKKPAAVIDQVEARARIADGHRAVDDEQA